MHSGSCEADQAPRSFVEAARRDQIVQAAIATIAELGYGQASFARIAQRAGISPSLISYHFHSRDELVAQIVADVNGALEQALERAAEGAATYGAALRAIVEQQVRHFGAHLPAVIALHQIYIGVRDEDGGLRYGARWREAACAEMAEMLRDGQAHGQFRAADPEILAATVIGTLEAVPAYLIGHPDADVEAYAQELATFVALATAPPRRRPRARSRR